MKSIDKKEIEVSIIITAMNEEEKKSMGEWNLTALTFMHVNEWVKVFEEVGYDGDYYWFIP